MCSLRISNGSTAPLCRWIPTPFYPSPCAHIFRINQVKDRGAVRQPGDKKTRPREPVMARFLHKIPQLACPSYFVARVFGLEATTGDQVDELNHAIANIKCTLKPSPRVILAASDLRRLSLLRKIIILRAYYFGDRVLIYEIYGVLTGLSISTLSMQSKVHSTLYI